jgi:RNA polymerase sigma-70 factor, ECF subfamily
MTKSSEGSASPQQRLPVADFSGLYKAHARDVHRFVLFLSGDPGLADDIVSETFIRLWNARKRVDLTTVRAYLFAIARNLFLQQRRRTRHGELDDRMADPQPGPDRRAQARSELADVMAALQELPEIDRAAVLMRADDAMSYEEIGTALGISPVAARVKVHRARMKLARARLAGGPTGWI